VAGPLRAAEEGGEGVAQRVLVGRASRPASRPALAVGGEDVRDERGPEGDALLLAEVLAEVPEGSPPSPPRREHHLDLRARLYRARRACVGVVVALGRAITAPAVYARGEPL